MNNRTKSTVSLTLALFAGAMDTVTGILLMVLPRFTLSLMGLSAAEEALVYVQFIGAFVFGVGSLYLWGFCGARFLGLWGGLAGIFYATAWVRFVIFVFVTLAVLGGLLESLWITVALTDGALAVAQVLWLWRGGIPRNG
jgi:hypothetical protein